MRDERGERREERGENKNISNRTVEFIFTVMQAKKWAA
jgi:hypothetical protein